MRRRKRWFEQLGTEPGKAHEVSEKTGRQEKSVAAHSQPHKDIALEKEKRSPGLTLDKELRKEMEQYLDQDLDDVRIHTDSNANQAASIRKARAFTRGSDVYFGKGRYAPNTTEGLKSLAHELAHVVQTGGRSSSDSDRFEQPQATIEREANEVADNVQMGLKTQLNSYTTDAGVLRQDEEKEAIPTTMMHPFDITPAHGQGVINAGPFSITFRYVVSEGSGETTLLLDIPNGVQGTFVPLGGVGGDSIKIEDPGGDKARTVRIVVPAETGELPRVRATFSDGTASYIVNFQFPG